MKNYKRKYLKYKNKYLLLKYKNKFRGGTLAEGWREDRDAQGAIL